MRWETMSLCRPCWDELYPGRQPHVLVRSTVEQCHRCRAVTTAGIYVRATVPGAP